MPLTPEQRKAQFRDRWATHHAYQSVDWAATAHTQESLVWYVCRYGGGQPYDTIVQWTAQEVARAADHLNKFIEAEVPKNT